MKQLVVLLLLSATGSALASEKPEVPRPRKPLEEVVVIGYEDWDFDKRKGALMMGLGGAYMIHRYDKARDEWHFVRASNEPKKDKE